ncbi:MAG TPA: ATP phosphoribosyltransferase [Propionibacterium sp.]|jgi:ATP phosphoribosyltransferase|nr:ATP phosphoribosyltransferase [Propionibacterium sp.]
MLKIAVPNKGSLSEAAQQMLREAGYRQRSDAKELVLTDTGNHVEFYYLRPRDIAVYVGEGTLDVGITGRDMLLDSGATAQEVMPLGFGATRFRYAAPADLHWEIPDLEGKRIATSYPGLVKADLARRGIEARLIKLDGAVESSIRLGVADAIADVVETGRTLRQAGMEVFGETILHSEAVLIKRADTPVRNGLERLQRRLSAVLVAENYVMMDYDCPEAIIDQAIAITPGFESPTVSPLAREGWVAVRAMVKRAAAQSVMDDLWELGARAILVTDIAACRL